MLAKIKIDNYNLIFTLDLQKRKFLGEEIINFFVNNSMNEVILDAVDLNIDKVLLDDCFVAFSLTNDKLIIKSRLKKGWHKIFINFRGELRETLGGLYLSRYFNKDKADFLVTTQFEPADARRAFPCFDNPYYKATFNLTLIIDKNLQAVSNTLPIYSEEINNNQKKIIFKQTPPMSTYLLYIGVGNFEFVSKKYKNILYRVITTPGKKEGAKFALDCSPRFVEYLERYFNHPYIFDKLDLIAIPDFAAGAMENWGAITFRENLLLYFPGVSSLSSKIRIAEVIAHELVHQWFGNLVTMKWWDDLWLNESFATYLAYKVVDFYYKHWEVMKEYVESEVISAFCADALLSSHPIKVKVNKVEEITEIFDEISYDKGGSVLRMIENYMGEKKFQKGLRLYIDKYKFKNASSDDLWRSLAFADKNILKIMKDYINKVGYPLITLHLNKNKFILEQKRFTFISSNNIHKNDKWNMPLFLSADQKNITYVFNKQRQNLTMLQNKSGVIINKNLSGFYIVDYPQDYYKLLSRHKNFNEFDWLALINDSYYLVLNNTKDLSFYYDVLDFYLQQKLSFKYTLSLLLSQTNHIFYLSPSLINKQYLEKISHFALEISGLQPQKNELPITATIRAKALINLGKSGDELILDYSQKLFKLYLKNKIHPDLKYPVLVNAVNIDDKYVEQMLKIFSKNTIFEEQAKILIALGNVKKINLLNDVLRFGLSDKLRFNQLNYLFLGLANNSFHQARIFKWLQQKWSYIEKKGGGPGKSDFVLLRLLKTILPNIGAFIDDKELKYFLKQQKNIQKFKTTVSNILELIKVNKNFRQRYLYED